MRNRGIKTQLTIDLESARGNNKREVIPVVYASQEGLEDWK